MAKLNRHDYATYWRAVHRGESDDLASVCFPDKPRYFNRFFDRSQRYAIDRFLRDTGLGLSGQLLLDVGCGRGRWLDFFEHRGARVFGIDFSEDAVRACMGRGFDARHASVTDLPFGDATFDIVTSVTVLLHLPYEMKARAVAEIARVLRPGGTALLLESTWRGDPSSHVYGLGLDEWTTLFARRGFGLRYCGAHYFNLVRRALPARVPLHDLLSVYVDYPLEFFLMRRYRGRASSLGLQHLLQFVLEQR